jgi:hypothetical protein
MIVATNDQAAVLSERARHALIAAGHVQDGPTVTLADNLASVGDHIVTRRNDRRLVSDNGAWVVNGQTWTITAIHAGGDAEVARHGDGATLRLPADYLARHTHLAYATTAHRAQGMTVDRAHATVDADTTHQQLYVAATRGRHANDLWVALDSDRDIIADDTHLPDPHQLLARALARPDPDRLSAHQLADDARTELHSLARLGAIFEDAARHVTDRWLVDTLADRGLDHASRDAEWGSLLDRARQLALQGHDLEELLDRAIGMRPIDDAHSIAGVLHWRLGQLAQHTEPARRPGPLRSLPTVGQPDEQFDLANAAGELIRHRWQQIRANLADHDGPLDFARALGPRPDDSADARSWLTAATAVAAYRERYDLPSHVQLLGERPGPLRPDAQAAYDHALLQVDRHLARAYRQLDVDRRQEMLQQLAASSMTAVGFDPEHLRTAHAEGAGSRRRWLSAAPQERSQAKSDHERARARIDALERLADQRLTQEARQRDHLDQRRRVELAFRSKVTRPSAPSPPSHPRATPRSARLAKSDGRTQLHPVLVDLSSAVDPPIVRVLGGHERLDRSKNRTQSRGFRLRHVEQHERDADLATGVVGKVQDVVRPSGIGLANALDVRCVGSYRGLSVSCRLAEVLVGTHHQCGLGVTPGEIAEHLVDLCRERVSAAPHPCCRNPLPPLPAEPYMLLE